MRCIPPILGLAILAGLGSCRPAPLTQPIPDNADTRAVVGFLEAYGRHDLDGMMRHLDEDAVFRGSAHSPRSCRTASMMGKMPYIPEWV